MRRMVAFNWPSTLAACPASPQTMLSEPQRSPYSEKFLEKEVAAKSAMPSCAKWRMA
ncbi:hypothetical protein D3C86_1949130 [compost metagenome]